MNLDRPSLTHLRERAAQARRQGHYAQAAQWEWKAVELAETLGLAGERARALLWEGYSLRQAGDDDLALAALLQALNAPVIDPGDRFSALTTLLHISLERIGRNWRNRVSRGQPCWIFWRANWRFGKVILPPLTSGSYALGRDGGMLIPG